MKRSGVPPHSLEAERSVLGAMLGDRESADTATEMLVPGDFYLERHCALFAALAEVHGAGMSGDPVVATEEIRKRGKFDEVGGSEYLADVLAACPSFANIERYCQIVREKSSARALLVACQEASIGILESGYEETLEALEAKVCRLRSGRGSAEARDWASLREEVVARAGAALDGKAPEAVRTGILPLDNFLGGLRRGDSIVVAGRPSMGKTALVTQMCARISADKAALLFSLETAAADAAQNILCRMAGVSSTRIYRGSISPDEHGKILGAANRDLDLWIDDTPAISMTALKSRARRFASRRNLGVIAVDYLGLLTSPEGDSREERIAASSRALKALARELSVPVVVVSQLNRMVEHRKDKRPTLADLRESGSIEQDADLILMLYRPAKYGVPGAMEGDCDVIVAKHRTGPTGTVSLRFVGDRMEFRGLKGG